MFLYQFLFVLLSFKTSNSKLKITDKVLLIGIDGLLQRCIGEADHSLFDYLQKEGSYTLKARTAIETMSGPGLSNIL